MCRTLAEDLHVLRVHAQEQNRHLDTIVLTTLGFVSALAVGILLVVNSIEALEVNLVFFVLSYSCYVIAIVYGYCALRESSILVPGAVDANRKCVHAPTCSVEVAELCLRSVIDENHRRRSFLRGTWRWTFGALFFVVLAIALAEMRFFDEAAVPAEALVLVVCAYPVLAFTFGGVVGRYSRSRSIAEERKNHLECGRVVSLEGWRPGRSLSFRSILGIGGS